MFLIKALYNPIKTGYLKKNKKIMEKREGNFSAGLVYLYHCLIHANAKKHFDTYFYYNACCAFGAAKPCCG
jgi:hypothetical protein